MAKKPPDDVASGKFDILATYLRGALAQVSYQSAQFLVILWSVGLTTEWNRRVFPIRSMLLPCLPHPMGFNGSPFLLDPESIPRVVSLFVSEFDRG